MSAQSNFNVFDGAATPVQHSMIALGTSRDENGVYTAEWGERLLGVPLNAQVAVVTRKRALKGGKEQCTLVVKVPVMETATGANAAGYTAQPAVAFEDTVVVNAYFSNRSPTLQRRLVRQIAANVLDGFVTTRAPTTTGPIPELFDLSVSPS